MRPWRPRPAYCSAAVTSVPCGAPAAASARARSLVEVVARRCSRGRPSTRSRRARCGPRRRARAPRCSRGRAAVDRQRERPVGVLVEQQLARRDVGERRRVVRGLVVDATRCAEPQPGSRPARRARRRACTLPKRSKRERVGDEAAVVVASGARAARSRRARRRRSGRRRPPSGAPAARCAATGAKMSRPWNVADDRLEAVRRARDVDGLDRAAEALGGEREQPVVGPDEDAVLLGRAQRDRAPLAADLGVDDREVHARREVGQRAAQRSARPSARRGASMPWVRSMTRASGAMRAMTPWQTPTNSSSSAVVGEEGDDRRHRARRESSSRFAARSAG